MGPDDLEHSVLDSQGAHTHMRAFVHRRARTDTRTYCIVLIQDQPDLVAEPEDWSVHEPPLGGPPYTGPIGGPEFPGTFISPDRSFGPEGLRAIPQADGSTTDEWPL